MDHHKLYKWFRFLFGIVQEYTKWLRKSCNYCQNNISKNYTLGLFSVVLIRNIGSGPIPGWACSQNYARSVDSQDPRTQWRLTFFIPLANRKFVRPSCTKPGKRKTKFKTVENSQFSEYFLAPIPVSHKPTVLFQFSETGQNPPVFP